MSERALLAGIALAVTIAALSVFLATPFGFGVTPDSVLYLDSAENLRNGLGFHVRGPDGSLVPLTHFPPLYPGTISLVSTLGLDGQSASRWVAAVIAAANVLVIFMATHHFTRSRTAATLASFFMALSLDMLFLNTAVLSDAQFIFFTLVTLLSLTSYLEGRGYRYLLAGAALAALACLGRYAGFILVAGAILTIVLLGSRPLRRRLADAALFAAIGFAPVLLWMSRNIRMSGQWSSMPITRSVPSFDHAGALIETACSWLFPGSNRVRLFPSQGLVVVMASLTACSVALYAFARAKRSAIDSASRGAASPTVFLFFAIVYVAFLLVAIAFVPNIPMDNRILAPAYCAALIAAAFVVHAAFTSSRTHIARAAATGIIGGLLILHAAVAAGTIDYFRREGRGFVGPRWHYPALEKTLRAVEPGAIVLSNYSVAVAFRMSRGATNVTRKTLSNVVALKGEAIVVYFDDARSYAPHHEKARKDQPMSPAYRIELLRGFHATVLAHERNGWVYRLGRG